MPIGTPRIVAVWIGYCDDMTSPTAKTVNVACYKMGDGAIELLLKVDVELGVTQYILEHARDTCMDLEGVKEYFSSPHSSLFVVETETI